MQTRIADEDKEILLAPALAAEPENRSGKLVAARTRELRRESLQLKERGSRRAQRRDAQPGGERGGAEGALATASVPESGHCVRRQTRLPQWFPCSSLCEQEQAPTSKKRGLRAWCCRSGCRLYHCHRRRRCTSRKGIRQFPHRDGRLAAQHLLRERLLLGYRKQRSLMERIAL